MPDTLVVIGASGDMARRLLFPALYRLALDDKLGGLEVRGFALDNWTTDEFRERILDGITNLAHLPFDKRVWQHFAARLSYHPADLTETGLGVLRDSIHGNAAFYLALPPGMFAEAAAMLRRAGLHESSEGWRRLVIEKPFGTDVESAVALNQKLHEHWSEEQIFRIDHYLGKETVQNILVFRFANRFMEPVLNAQHVEWVQITAAETLGLEGRYRYYDGIGALRDMIQSHLMQLLALTAMEPPALWDAEIIHDHKAEVLQSVRAVPPDAIDSHAARGQYVRSKEHGTGNEEQGSGSGSDPVLGSLFPVPVPGYREEGGIEDASRTETFAAVKLYIDNWRWAGVPFYLRSGKRMTMDLTEVAIQFREPPQQLFLNTGLETAVNNRLVFRLRPAEAIDLFVRAREPGLELRTRELALHAPYAAATSEEGNSYENLLMDVFEGDKTSFLRFDEVEWAWRVLQPILDAWQTGEPEPYAAGSDGPAGQSRILEPGHAWRPLALDGVNRMTPIGGRAG